MLNIPGRESNRGESGPDGGDMDPPLPIRCGGGIGPPRMGCDGGNISGGGSRNGGLRLSIM